MPLSHSFCTFLPKKFVLSHAVNTVFLDRQMLLREKDHAVPDERERERQGNLLSVVCIPVREKGRDRDGWMEGKLLFLSHNSPSNYPHPLCS